MTAAPTAQAAAGCQVDYSVSSQWQGGFGANVSHHQPRRPHQGWTLTWTFSAGQTITQLWNGMTPSPAATSPSTNAPYNGAIPTGGSTSFGFNGSWNTSNPAPVSFALNGTTCTGSGPRGRRRTTPTIAAPPLAVLTAEFRLPHRHRPRRRAPPRPGCPCDIYAAGGTPCVAAHSTSERCTPPTAGTLYQVRRSSDNATQGHRRPDRRRIRQRRDAGLVLRRHLVRDHRRLRPVRPRKQRGLPGAGRGGRQRHPGERDARIADGRRAQGVRPLHQPGQQLLAQRLLLRHADSAAHRRAHTW